MPVNTKVIANGDNLKMMLAQTNISQRKVAERIGVSHYTVSRWAQPGLHRVPVVIADKLASVLGITKQDLALPPPESLRENEREWLSIYRDMTPLEQAKARLAVESILANDAHDRSSRDN